MISFLDYEELSSPMSACSEILRFLLHHYHRTIIRETDHDKGGGDPFGYKALYEELRFHECVEDDLDLSYRCCWPGIPRCVFQRFSMI